MRRIISPARKFHRRNPIHGWIPLLPPEEDPLDGVTYHAGTAAGIRFGIPMQMVTTRKRAEAVWPPPRVGCWKILFPIHQRLVGQSPPFGCRPCLLFNLGEKGGIVFPIPFTGQYFWFKNLLPRLLSQVERVGELYSQDFISNGRYSKKNKCLHECLQQRYIGEGRYDSCYINLERRGERSKSGIMFRAFRN